MAERQGMFYRVENSKEGIASLTGQAPLSFEGMPVEGWSIGRIAEAGVEISVFKVAAGAVYGSHAAPSACVCVVADGAGELFLTDDAGRKLAAVPCRKGDAYLQGADVRHGFRNGPEETTLIYVRAL